MSEDHESPHEVIYLQYWATEPTWCQDRIDGDLSCDESDTVYVRDDIYELALETIRLLAGNHTLEEKHFKLIERVQEDGP